MEHKKSFFDPRKRRVVLSMDVNHRGDVEITKDLLIRASELIAAIIDRQNTTGLSGHQKNYAVCRAIAKLRMSLDQSTMVWSSDNINTFERMHLDEMETMIRARRIKNFDTPIKPPSPFRALTMGAGKNPNTVDLITTIGFSKYPENAGMPFRIVQYKLDDAEIERIKRDGVFSIAFMGVGMPPMLPFVESLEELGFYAAMFDEHGRIVNEPAVLGESPEPPQSGEKTN